MSRGDLSPEEKGGEMRGDHNTIYYNYGLFSPFLLYLSVIHSRSFPDDDDDRRWQSEPSPISPLPGHSGASWKYRPITVIPNTRVCLRTRDTLHTLWQPRRKERKKEKKEESTSKGTPTRGFHRALPCRAWPLLESLPLWP